MNEKQTIQLRDILDLVYSKMNELYGDTWETIKYEVKPEYIKEYEEYYSYYENKIKNENQ